MRNRRLDPNTIQRLSSGRLHPDDAPPGYVPVAGLLGAAARRPSASVSYEDVPATVVAMVDIIRSTATPEALAERRPSMLTKLCSAKVAAAAVSAVLVAGTAAGAATGSLPRPVQNAVSSAATHGGLDVPTADDHAKAGDISKAGGEHRGAGGNVADRRATVAGDAGNNGGAATPAEDQTKRDQGPAVVPAPGTSGTSGSNRATSGSRRGRNSGSGKSGSGTPGETTGDASVTSPGSGGDPAGHDAINGGELTGTTGTTMPEVEIDNETETGNHRNGSGPSTTGTTR
jgi:hypothetical protein